MSFLAVDYRGYGRSTGDPSVSAMLDDARLILRQTKEWLTTNNRTGPLLVMGRSLGSACAIEVAQACQAEVVGLIIESGFADTLPLLETLGVDVQKLGLTEKKHCSIFLEATSKLWNCYNASNRRSFSQRVRRLIEWAQTSAVPSVILDPIKKLYANLSSYSMAYNYPGAHRTSNMLDRLMQKMDRHLFSTRYFHGCISSAELNIRGWALIQNFAPSNPTTVRKYNGYNSPAARLNQRQYHDRWLENLLISASLGGVRTVPQNPLE